MATFDISYACLFWWLKAQVPMQRIFQSVATGVLGPASFEGGAGSAALGLGLHYSIAMAMAVAYYIVARQLVARLTAHAQRRCCSAPPTACSYTD